MIATMADHVVAIAQDMFTAMIDGEPGLLTEGPDGTVTLTEPVHAWVEIRGEEPFRTLVMTGRETADRMARALLALQPQDAVAPDDVRDALGEVANVIGGNIKGLMPQPGSLTLPVVELDGQAPEGALLWERPLLWCQDPVVISMWGLDPTHNRKEDTL